MSIKFELNLADLIPLIISFWALLIAYKNRRNVMRENIYNRQINCFEEIQKRTNKVADLVYKYQESDKIKINIEELHLENDMLYEYIESKAVVIPEELFKKVGDFISLINNSIIEDTKIVVKDMMKKYVEIENYMRVFIGLEKLSEENRRLVK